MSHQNHKFHRRSFLRMTTGAAVVSGFAVPTIIPRSALAAPGRPGANDRVAVGCVSAGYRARLLMEQLPEAARLIAIADCNLPQALLFKKENFPRCNDALPAFSEQSFNVYYRERK